MLDQTAIDEDAPRSGDAGACGAATDLAALLHDALTLANLQRHLFAADLRRAKSTLWRSTIFFAAGAALAAGCIPIAVVTLAVFLIDAAHLSRLSALCWSLAAGLVAAGVQIAAAYRLMRRAPVFLHSSAEEWSANMEWLKTVTRRLSRSANSRPGANGAAQGSRPVKENRS